MFDGSEISLTTPSGILGDEVSARCKAERDAYNFAFPPECGFSHGSKALFSSAAFKQHHFHTRVISSHTGKAVASQRSRHELDPKLQVFAIGLATAWL